MRRTRRKRTKAEAGGRAVELTAERALEQVARLKRRGARLITITAIRRDGFELVYHLDLKGRIVTVSAKQREPDFKSVIDIFPNAEIYEREAHEFFGIHFDRPEAHKPLFLQEPQKTETRLSETASRKRGKGSDVAVT